MVYHYKEKSLSSLGVNKNSTLIDLLKNTTLRESSHTNKYGKTILHSIRTFKRMNKVQYKDLDSDALLFKSYKIIMKSIARRIRKEDPILDRSIKDLQSNRLRFYLSHLVDSHFTGMKGYLKINPKAYAYLMWRREIEGHDEYTKVHSKLVNNRNKYKIPSLFTAITSTNFYKYFQSQWNIHFQNNIHSDVEDFLCVLEHMMAYIFLHYYNSWLKFAYEISNITFKETIFYHPPVFIVRYPTETKSKEIKVYCLIDKIVSNSV